MTSQVKIVLSVSRGIPFNQLALSQANVRRVKAGVSIDALAADIARRGLLQSLTVRAQRDAEGNDTGRFEVPAGGRRFRALQQLVKQRRMAKTEPVPCIVREDEQISAEEDSLAENVHREALHPLDQFRAMQQLVTQGTDVETIAATFMTTPAVPGTVEAGKPVIERHLRCLEPSCGARPPTSNSSASSASRCIGVSGTAMR